MSTNKTIRYDLAESPGVGVQVDLPRQAVGRRLFVDADGYVWWDNQDMTISMASTNPANTPTPRPWTYYAPEVPREHGPIDHQAGCSVQPVWETAPPAVGLDAVGTYTTGYNIGHQAGIKAAAKLLADECNDRADRLVGDARQAMRDAATVATNMATDAPAGSAPARGEWPIRRETGPIDPPKPRNHKPYA